MCDASHSTSQTVSGDAAAPAASSRSATAVITSLIEFAHQLPANLVDLLVARPIGRRDQVDGVQQLVDGDGLLAVDGREEELDGGVEALAGDRVRDPGPDDLLQLLAVRQAQVEPETAAQEGRRERPLAVAGEDDHRELVAAHDAVVHGP